MALENDCLKKEFERVMDKTPQNDADRGFSMHTMSYDANIPEKSRKEAISAHDDLKITDQNGSIFFDPFAAPECSDELNHKFRMADLYHESLPLYPELNTLKSRLDTFDNWPNKSVPPNKLAEAGFFYTKKDDRVYCFHCGLGLQNWEEKDDPWLQHLSYFDGCEYFLSGKGKEFIRNLCERRNSRITVENFLRLITFKDQEEREMGITNDESFKNNDKVFRHRLIELMYEGKIPLVFEDVDFHRL